MGQIGQESYQEGWSMDKRLRDVKPEKLKTAYPRVVRLVGRQPKYNSPEEILPLVQAYLETAEVPNVAGLACALNVHVQTLLDWGQNERFALLSGVVKGAKQWILDFTITGMMKNRLNVAGSIFYLKNMFGWCDVPQETNTGKALDILKSFIDKEQSNTIDITPVKTTAKQVVSHADTS